MQVKKFEARTMKEALEMVKSQLGPEAIILSARDNNRSFGLVGEGSVEITAAVSEETLHKKKFTESRLRGQDLEAFSKSPARVQKKMIDRMVTKHVEKNQPRPVTSRRYIDIDDEGGDADQWVSEPAHASAQAKASTATKPAYHARVSSAKVAQALAEQMPSAPPARAEGRAPMTQAKADVRAPAPIGDTAEVVALKGEIASLREVIAKFQEVPQHLLGAHPGADYGIPYDLSGMFERLTSTGISAEIAAEILVRAQENIPALKLKNRSLVEGWVARHLLETTHVTGDRPAAKVQVFVGPAGGGKTTALVKMASHLVVRERRRVALLTTDVFKVGATDQMRIYAQILNVPFAIIRTPSDWNDVMKYLGNIDVVLIDTPGFSLKSPEEIESLRRLMPPPILNPRVHFTASATGKDADVTEAAKRYSVIGFDDAIFTALDESAQHGTLYNFIQRFGVPLHAFGIGPRVPDDFEPATRERMLDLIFKITKEHRLQEAP